MDLITYLKERIYILLIFLTADNFIAVVLQKINPHLLTSQDGEISSAVVL